MQELLPRDLDLQESLFSNESNVPELMERLIIADSTTAPAVL